MDLNDRELRLACCAFTHAVEPILITDAQANITMINDQFIKVFGYSDGEVVGKSPSILKSGLHSSIFYQELWLGLSQNDMWIGEISNRKKNGELILMLVRINTVKDEMGCIQNYIGFFTDLMNIKKPQDELELAAFYDSLTGLPNRAMLYKKTITTMMECSTNQEKMAIAYIDLDGFKQINDVYGHDVGDDFLKRISENLQSHLRDGDMIARLGGDEFVVVLMDIVEKNELRKVLERLLVLSRQKYLIQGSYLSVSASIGVAIYPDDATEPELLIRLADKAMYQSKRSGKNKYMFHKR